MTRCWNCGLPDVAERCPRCGAPQERRGPGGPPPPAAPSTGQSGGLRQAPEFIVNGVPVDPRAPNYPGGPLPPQGPRPSGYQSGPLSPEPRAPSHTSGPLPSERLPGRTSGPLSSEGLSGRTSGPLPPGGGYRQTRPAPEGWDEEQLRPPVRPTAGPVLPARPQGNWDEAAPDAPAYGAASGRGVSRPMPQNGWDEQYGQPPAGRARREVRAAGQPEQETSGPLPYPSEKAARQRPQERVSFSSSIWDNEQHPMWDEPELLTLSGMVNALLGATIGALFGGMVWVGVTFVTGMPLPYLTVVVGLLAGLGARFTLEQTRPWSLGIFAAIGALIGFVVAQYGLFDYALAAQQARQGLFSSWFPLSPLQFIGVYWDYLINVADPINSKLGQLGPHPTAFVEMLACVAMCWCLLILRKR